MKGLDKTKKYEYVILDPSSPEVNRGSFCYSPYLLHNYFKEMGKSVYFMEDFSMPDFDSIPECDQLLVSIWSYPQIDTALMIQNFIRNKKPLFFGYRPMIEFYGLPTFQMTDEMLEIGILSYPQHYGDFKHLLLSDCDLHLNKFIKPERNNMVYPLFDSYGCSHGCKFCPSTANQPKPIHPDPDDLVKVIERANKEANVHNIHFTGENLFRDSNRAYRLLKGISDLKLDMYFICLSTAPSILKFIEKYGSDIIEDSGIKLIEVGFESASLKMQKAMGKKFNSSVEDLALLTREKEFEIFWLTMTFFPGECIDNLVTTGEFLKKYGFDWKDVHPRIATNSTVGGLGQYFQPYHGTSGFTLDSIREHGELLSYRPLRLRPGFIPNTFLNDRFKRVKDWSDDDRAWLDLYGLAYSDLEIPDGPITMREALFNEMNKISYEAIINNGINWEHDHVAEMALKYALAARLGVVEAV